MVLPVSPQCSSIPLRSIPDKAEHAVSLTGFGLRPMKKGRDRFPYVHAQHKSVSAFFCTAHCQRGKHEYTCIPYRESSRAISTIRGRQASKNI